MNVFEITCNCYTQTYPIFTVAQRSAGTSELPQRLLGQNKLVANSGSKASNNGSAAGLQQQESSVASQRARSSLLEAGVSVGTSTEAGEVTCIDPLAMHTTTPASTPGADSMFKLSLVSNVSSTKPNSITTITLPTMKSLPAGSNSLLKPQFKGGMKSVLEKSRRCIEAIKMAPCILKDYLSVNNDPSAGACDADISDEMRQRFLIQMVPGTPLLQAATKFEEQTQRLQTGVNEEGPGKARAERSPASIGLMVAHDYIMDNTIDNTISSNQTNVNRNSDAAASLLPTTSLTCGVEAINTNNSAASHRNRGGLKITKLGSKAHSSSGGRSGRTLSLIHI